MKHLKTLGLSLLAASVITAILGAGTASAAGVLCENNTSTPCNSKWAEGAGIEFSLKSGTSWELKRTDGAVLQTCTGSTLKGTVGKPGGAGSSTSNAWIQLTGLTFAGCSEVTAVPTLGTLEIMNNAGTNDGTVGAKTLTVTVFNTALNTTCNYTAGTAATLGTFVAGKTGLNGTLTINAVLTRSTEHGGSVFCPESARWTAEYTQTGVTPLFIRAS